MTQSESCWWDSPQEVNGVDSAEGRKERKRAREIESIFLWRSKATDVGQNVKLHKEKCVDQVKYNF